METDKLTEYLYPSLEYKMPFKTKIMAVALGFGVGVLIVSAMMAAIVAWV